MTDAEFAEYIGIKEEPNAAAVVAKFDPKKRAVIERMAELEGEIALWQAGVGKKPSGVILCGRREIKLAGAPKDPS